MKLCFGINGKINLEDFNLLKPSRINFTKFSIGLPYLFECNKLGFKVFVGKKMQQLYFDHSVVITVVADAASKLSLFLDVYLKYTKVIVAVAAVPIVIF